MTKIALLLACLALPAAADGNYKGAHVDLDFKQVPLEDVLQIVADTGHVNIVPIDVGSPTIDVTAKSEPWDQVLDEVIAKAKLAYARTGNVYVIGAQSVIDARKGKKTTYTGSTIDLDVVDLDATAAVELVSAVSGTAFQAKPGAPRRVHVRLKRVPADEVAELVMLQAGATAVDKPSAPAKASGCAGASTTADKLKLVAIAAAGMTRIAVVTDGTSTWRVGKGDCLGNDKVAIRDMGLGWVTLDKRHDLQLHPQRP